MVVVGARGRVGVGGVWWKILYREGQNGDWRVDGGGAPILLPAVLVKRV